MRILAITHQYPTPEDPTFAPYNRQQFGELARRHELRLIRPVPWPTAIAAALRSGGRPVEAIDDGIRIYRPAFRYPPRMLHHCYGTFFERSVSRTERRVIEEFRPDVLLSAWAHPDGWATARIGRRHGLPVVVKVIGSDVLVLAAGVRRERVSEALRGVDTVIAVSRDLADHVAALGVQPDRICVVPEGISLTQFSPGSRSEARRALRIPDDERMILFVGNVLASKGALDLVEACGRLRDRGLAFRCRFVGRVHQRPALERLLRVHRVAAHVELVGVRPQRELALWYRASNVVALPSHSEGVPNVLREALACGRPFVATRVGGIPEIADPSYCRLVAPRDPGELALAIESMLLAPPAVDPERVARVTMSWADSAGMVARCLEDAVARGARREATHPDPVSGTR